MKAFQIIRDVLVILACLCVLGLTYELVRLDLTVRHRISQIDNVFSTPDAPTPTGTGCPFGADQCGG